jgi:hypothetical protein
LKDQMARQVSSVLIQARYAREWGSLEYNDAPQWLENFLT